MDKDNHTCLQTSFLLLPRMFRQRPRLVATKRRIQVQKQNGGVMIYFIRLNKEMGGKSPRGKARHYVGFCTEGRLHERMQEHRSGQGARLLHAANKKGIKYRVIATMPGNQADERAIKNQKNTRKYLKKRWNI